MEAATAAPLRILFLLTVLALLPAIVISMTAFLRIILVLGLLRHAMGFQQVPPNQVLIGLALFLTYFVMGTTFDTIYENAVSPMLAGEISETEALERGRLPITRFMVRQTRESDLALMANLGQAPAFESPDDVPIRVLVPAFVISELRVAFMMGFLLFVPFLIIDLAVAALLNALGMIMLPPPMIAMPFKLLIFVAADGWKLLIGALVKSFGA